MSNNNNNNNNNEEGDDDVVAFASVDFDGVNFDVMDPIDAETKTIFGDYGGFDEHDNRLRDLAKLLACGNYPQILRETPIAFKVFHNSLAEAADIRQSMRQRVVMIGSESVEACIELEFVGIAALNLFLQSNYTGPSLEPHVLEGINPHAAFHNILQVSNNLSSDNNNNKNSVQNAVLSELAVDGYWPCQVCSNPYFLLIARLVLSTLADPTTCSGDWRNEREFDPPPQEQANDASLFVKNVARLQAVHVWGARAIVAHERLLQSREPSTTLWKEAQAVFSTCKNQFCNSDNNPLDATILLEVGLAEHHFDRVGNGKKSFEAARHSNALTVQVTGDLGKRTKYQTKATAQMVVRAKSAPAATANSQSRLAEEEEEKKEHVQKQRIEHGEDAILLEKIQFEQDTKVDDLSILDQSILLALCLDVKNSNPADGLTGEQMGAFLARVLEHHNDWMIYSTALLERAWLEFERSHARERAILQLQALVDQHTNRLTLTQSTRESIEQSAPVQERLKNLHSIVYPPRWSMIQDLADRYAALGIVTSAAELYMEIEAWDQVVECYKRAGRVSYAETIVRERLAVQETPRMWAVLGDLTKDPTHYEKAIELSKGRYSDAYLALGEYYFDKGDLVNAADKFEKALKVRPLVPAAWFRLGTICMQLGQWQKALRAFSQVVMQEPEEADAWANIAAVHMRNRQPDEAYPALNESLKYRRSNWRVWVSKLHACLDLKKYDEAIQACNLLLDLRSQRQASDNIPMLEENCVRAIVGGTLTEFREARGDYAALDSARRTLSRVHALLDRICATSVASQEPWILETMTFFREQTGQDSRQVLEALMKEYQTLTSTTWEKDNYLVRKLCQVVSHMVQIYTSSPDSNLGDLIKARFLVRGVIQKIEAARPDDNTIPEEVERLRNVLPSIEEKIKQLQS